MWLLPRSFALLLSPLVALALGCATYSEPAEESAQWSESMRSKASMAADATARGAREAGKAVAVAYQGVRQGFEEPDPKAYGPFPKRYAKRIRHHMVHLQGVSKEASFQFGWPEKGYVNAGLLAGGGVAWQGYLVEVEVREEALFKSQVRPQNYVVRMRDGEVFEVVEAEYADGLRWTDREADQRGKEPDVASNLE